MTDSRLSACIFSMTPSLLESLTHQLQQGDFVVRSFQNETTFARFVLQEEAHVDCLIIESGIPAHHVLSQFQEQQVFLPCVLMIEEDTQEADGEPDEAIEQQQTTSLSISSSLQTSESNSLYHKATQRLSKKCIVDLQSSVKQAINDFLRLPATSPLIGDHRSLADPSLSENVFTSLSNKQRQLSVKLQERLGYLGVYYKRDPEAFLRRMKPEEKQAFLARLRQDYRDIILNYFSDTSDLNQKIDRYVTTAFFADVPTAQMVQIHMELMDEFSKQLKLEGRNEEILLDYRLTLIDMLANLCELYRRSIPRL